MKRILVILEAGDVLASGFVRGTIYREYFARSGYRVRYVSRLYVPLVRLMNKPPKIFFPLFFSGFRRILNILQKPIIAVREKIIILVAGRYDVIYMSNKIQSYFLVKNLRQKTTARLILDFGDALWLSHQNIRMLNEILKLVDVVTTDNQYTAEYVRRYNNKCFIVPDPSQVEFFDMARPAVKPAREGRVTLGWVGDTNSAYNLYLVWEPLERLFAKYSNLHLRLVGVGLNRKLLPDFEKVKFSVLPFYNQPEMIKEVLAMDIGLFPLYDVEATRTRGVLKAEVYMSGEAAVVCSPVGQCRDLIKDGVNGMLASSPEEWEEKLERLIVDVNLRQKITAAGLETVRREFSLEKCFAKLIAVIENKPEER